MDLANHREFLWSVSETPLMARSDYTISAQFCPDSFVAEKFGMSEFFGESHDVSIVDMSEPRPQLREGSTRTAGAHAQCLPTDFTALC